VSSLIAPLFCILFLFIRIIIFRTQDIVFIPIEHEHIIFFISFEQPGITLIRTILNIHQRLHSLHSCLDHTLCDGLLFSDLLLQRHLHIFFLLQNPTP
jgi:hypothetical protein